MTATNSQQKSPKRAIGNSPFKVIPPTIQAKAQAGQKTPSPVQPAAQTDLISSKVSTSPNPYGSWAIAGFLLLGLGAIAYLPIPNYVTGEAQITSRMNARQCFTMPVSGTVKISVQSNQIVSPGQLIAEIVSPDLESQIAK